MLILDFGFNEAIDGFLGIAEVEQKQREWNELIFSFKHLNEFDWMFESVLRLFCEAISSMFQLVI